MTQQLIMSGSGIRGIVGGSLTPTVALNVGAAFAEYTNKGTIIVGGDTRTTHDTYKAAVISGLTAVGATVIDIGKVPTPTCQQMIRHHNADGAIVITASHNPVIWNGLKLMNSSGSFFNSTEHQAFTDIYTNKSWRYASWDNVGQVQTDSTALQTHIDHIFTVLDPSPIKNANLKVLIDPNQGAGCQADTLLLEALNVDYTILNGEGNGHFAHDPEPTETNVQAAITAMKNGDYDIGFVQDADADRLVIIDENGRFIGEDYSLAFCIDYILEKENATNAAVVVNLSTSNVIEDIATKHKAVVHQTKIGETFVTEGLKKRQAIVGGEGNGGVIYPKIGWGRDSLVGIVVALLHLAERKKTVSDIVSTYPSYTMLREKVQLTDSSQVTTLLQSLEAQFQNETCIKEDGLKVILDDKWIHVRPSNTEPIIRIFIEAKTLNDARGLLKYSNLM